MRRRRVGWCLCTTPLTTPGLPLIQLPSPLSQSPAVLVQSTPQAAAGAGVGQAATEPPLPQQRLLSEVPLSARGARWQLRQKPYVPWNPSQTQLWEARTSSLGRGNGLPQSVSLCWRGIHCAEGPSPA